MKEAAAPPWSLSPQAHLEALGAGPTGLSRAEAASRLSRWGLNLLEARRGTSVWRTLAGQLRSPLVLLLLAAAAVSLAVGAREDAAIISGIVLIGAD